MGPDFGKPDRPTVDAEGAPWNARFGGSCVLRFLANGTLDTTVSLPVPNITCCCIGGANLDCLFVTTARILMTDAQLEAAPFAGGIYTAEIQSRGLPHGTHQA